MTQLLRNAIRTFVNNLSNKVPKPITSQSMNKFSEDASKVVTEEEIKTLLQKKFPTSRTITVEDVSGGCGAMFNIFVEADEFKGLSIVKQHRVVYDTLKEQIKTIHGLHLETKVP